jgi:mannose-6-phosphate isomerase-like protein (cupin superfamily)
MPTVLPIRGQISTNIRVCVKPFTHWCRTYAARLDTRGDTAGRVPSVLRSRGIRRRLWQVLVVLMTTGVVLAIEAPGVAPSASESAGTRRRPRCRGQAAPRHDARRTAAGDASVLASRHLSRPGRRRGGEGAARYCRGGIRSDVVVHDPPLDWRPAATSEHVATVGPLPLEPRAVAYTAMYLATAFRPGLSRFVHERPRPEAWFILTGEQCLETPDGPVRGRAGDGVVVRGGLPTTIQATGNEIQRNLTLVLHDAAKAATTRVDHWKPRGLCRD